MQHFQPRIFRAMQHHPQPGALRFRCTSATRTCLAAGVFFSLLGTANLALAQDLSVSPVQRATAQQVARQGVPLADLAPSAPERYVVQSGDTLWSISGLYLRQPWRWPELWGMNLQAISNPHLIFPGQTLYLERQDGFARLRMQAAGQSDLETVRVSPRTRSSSLSDTALPTLKMHLIEPFLVEPLVVDADTLEQAARVVATVDQRVLMSSGDRIYARGNPAAPLSAEAGEPRFYRVFRNAVALKDPTTQEILGYEAQYLGQAELVLGESVQESADSKGKLRADPVPATVQLLNTREEVRAGDRLLPAPERAFADFVPHAPPEEMDAQVVSIYGGSAFANAAQNQVIAISRGQYDGLQPGAVLSLLSRGQRLRDNTDASRPVIQLPSESNGMAMVFRTFDRVSYALILDVRAPVQEGDRLTPPK